MQTKLPPFSDFALRQLRAGKAGMSNRSAPFSIGGIPKPNPKPRAKITLRRADYEQQRGGR